MAESDDVATDPIADLNAVLPYELEDAGFSSREGIKILRFLANAGVTFTFPPRYRLSDQSTNASNAVIANKSI